MVRKQGKEHTEGKVGKRVVFIPFDQASPEWVASSTFLSSKALRLSRLILRPESKRFSS